MNSSRKCELVRRSGNGLYNYVLLLMQTEPGSIPGSGEALAKFSRNYAELYWDFNESIPRPLGGQELPENGFIFTPKI